MARPRRRAPAADGGDPGQRGLIALTRAITFSRLEVASFTHSGVYAALLACAFVLGNPEPATFILGMSHGLIWIVMSLVCLAAARWHIIPFWLAVTVAVLGGLGPFAGSLGFLAETRRRRSRTAPGSRYS